jgi:hypothetical protein
VPRSPQRLAALALLLLASCGGDEFPPVTPVSGRVLVDGQPAADCMVFFYRTFDDARPHRVSPLAVTGPDGRFKVTSYLTDDGAPPGEYAVGVEWRERSGVLGHQFDGPDRLGGAYANKDIKAAVAPFRVTVGKEPLVLPDFDLKTPPDAKRKNSARKGKAPALGGAR